MTFFTIFSIVVIVLFITAMLAAAYFAIKAVLTGDVSQLVALAEMTTASPGPRKWPRSSLQCISTSQKPSVPS